jgi:BolA family transcriptional regulator, general stress-responsive regulator
MATVQDKLKEKLQVLAPTHLAVIDDSAQHAGHAGNPDGEGQTHFSIEIVSPAFAGKSRLERHRIVMDLLEPVWKDTSLHALTLVTRTPDE